MPRIARNNLETLYFHIIVQGINKEYIFDTETNIKKYKDLMRKYTKDAETQVLAYCIMSNHAHILVYTKNKEEMGKIMQKINTSYAKYYNKTKDRVGIVFKNRYFTQPILDQKQLYNCLVYIHRNPVKAEMVEKIEDYKYSSYNEWIKENDIISKQSSMLIFRTEKIGLETFKQIYLRNNNPKDIAEISEIIDYKDIIDEYRKKEKLEYILINTKLLSCLIKDLKEKANLSIRQISEILKINRPKITKILKDIENKK